MSIEVWKGTDKIATSRKLVQLVLRSPEIRALPELEPIEEEKSLSVVYFARLDLEPPVIFKHFSGVGLMHFLDHANVTSAEPQLEVTDLRYVHGRSEAMRGNPSVTAVLLAKPNFAILEAVWRASLPTIYSAFLRDYDAR